MKTNDKPWPELFQGDLKSYKEYLLKDFEKNEYYANIVNALFFSKISSITECVKGIEGERFATFKQTTPGNFWTIDEVQKLQTTPEKSY